MLIWCLQSDLQRCTRSRVQDHAAWLLANIACESCACVLEAGALPPLLKLLDEQKQDTPSEISLVKTGTWLLSNLCQVSFPLSPPARIPSQSSQSLCLGCFLGARVALLSPAHR